MVQLLERLEPSITKANLGKTATTGSFSRRPAAHPTVAERAFAPLDGRVVLITGANSGIGFATARELAQDGATIVMICRHPARAAAARDEIARLAAGAEPVLFLADLSSQHAIRAVADKIRNQFGHIDVLINNAGAVFGHRELTVDGIEKTFATNHLAPFLLTNLLLDRVRAAPAGRIVNITSEIYGTALDFDNLQGERRYNFFAAYRKSKLENILFTYELARRLEGTNTTVNCVSPGPTATGFGGNMRGVQALFPAIMKRIPFLFGSPEKGARTSVYVATAHELAGKSGRFFFRCRETPTKPITHDVALARRLWALSEELVAGSVS